MSFSLQLWRDKFSQKLSELAFWLDQGYQRQLPYVAYSALAASALWPLIETAGAAFQTGQPLPVAFYTALGSLAGAVGGDLLAEQVRRLADRADQLNLGAVADDVAAQAPVDSELRAALDALLEKLDAVPQATARLPEAQRPRFLDTLQQELSALGSQSQPLIAIVRDGALALGSGNIVAGQGAVIVQGQAANISTGPTYVDKQIIQTGPPQTEPATLRQTYLNHLLQTIRRLSLAGIDPQAASEARRQLDLTAVYTALLTMATDEAELGRPRRRAAEPDRPRPLSALRLLDGRARLVLLGDPGSGKSTFVNFVALCLAGAALGDPDLNLTALTAPLPDEKGEDEPERQPWQRGPLLPVRVILRDFAAAGLPPASQPATAEHLWQHIAATLTPPEFAPHLRRILLEEGGLVLLDGLDEVPEAEQRRAQIKQAVEDFAGAFPRCRLLVTSRTYAYQKQDWRLESFAEAVLAPFHTGQIRRFVTRWYDHIGALRNWPAVESQGRAALLQQAIAGSDRLGELAERPLLLTLMASLHAWRGGSLPEKREELYRDTVDLLLDWWESQRVAHNAAGDVVILQPSLAEWLKVDRAQVRKLLNRLAYEAHAAQPADTLTADIPDAALVAGLLALSQNPDVRPQRLVEYLSQRAGLLLPHGVGVHTFPHRTIQEYLAACHLTDAGFPDTLAELARRDPARWREVALLAGAKAVRGMAAAVWLLADALCYRPPAAASGLEDAWGARLAGQLLVESADLAHLTPAQADKAERIRRWQVSLLRGDQLPAAERAGAAAVLADLTDPRPELMTLEGMHLCYVPPGPFWLGSAKQDTQAEEDERPQRRLDLSTPYWLGRYPVTRAQYAIFVAEGGYAAAELWPEARAAGVWRSPGQAKDYFSNAWRVGPRPLGREFDRPNQPVVGLTWFEALAFTRWLTRRWQAAGLLPPDWCVRLPSEAEWEKAARGGLAVPAEPVVSPASDRPWAAAPAVTLIDNPQPQRIYPWGDAFDPNRANGKDLGLGAPSGVGCFPLGASPYGCEELSGNVYEWTRSQSTRYPYVPTDGREDETRVGLYARITLRGGGWGSNANWLRCAVRDGYYPNGGHDDIGFRLVVSRAPAETGKV